MDRRVEQVPKIINERFEDCLSELSLCRSVNLSPARLRHLFKKETGLPPMQYLKHVRLKRAATLLRTSFLSIKEIIFQSGAKDISHFVRDFKKLYPSGLATDKGSSCRAFCCRRAWILR